MIRNKKKETVLDENTITFGKYKDLSLSSMLRDRKYCSWLLEQDWFLKQYEYLYNQVKNYNPRINFVNKSHYDIKSSSSVSDFVVNYEYFYLTPVEELKIELNDNEKICYKFYLESIEKLKQKLIDSCGNPNEIKAPSSWLKKFEEKYSISRDIFKEFLTAHELPNIPYIVEDIKKVCGVEYKGAKSYIIAKEKSLNQEKFWENVLKSHFGEDIGSQYKYKNCFFDFIHIKNNTLYECKLGLKDFNEDQHKKYKLILGTFDIVYLISNDCIIDLKRQTIYTSDVYKYLGYFLNLTTHSKFDTLVKNYPIVEMCNINEYFTKYQ
jgi:hypothetical protein